MRTHDPTFQVVKPERKDEVMKQVEMLSGIVPEIVPLLNEGRDWRRWLFVLNFLECFSPERAAKLSGYTTGPGPAAWGRLLRNDKQLKPIIDKMLALVAFDRAASGVKLLKHAEAAAVADMRDVAEWTDTDLRVKASGEITDGGAARIRKIKKTVDRDGRETVEVELNDGARYSKMVLDAAGMGAGSQAGAQTVNINLSWGSAMEEADRRARGEVIDVTTSEKPVAIEDQADAD